MDNEVGMRDEGESDDFTHLVERAAECLGTAGKLLGDRTCDMRSSALSVSLAIVEAWGGTIRLADSPRGARFEVQLPVATADKVT